MNNSANVELNIEIVATDATEEEADSMTRQLLAELRDSDVESVELAKGSLAPAGTKSVDPVMVGNIAIAVLPTFLPKVVEVVQAWASRGHGRTVKFKGKVVGQSIDFEGSADDLQKLLETLSKGKKKK